VAGSNPHSTSRAARRASRSRRRRRASAVSIPDPRAVGREHTARPWTPPTAISSGVSAECARARSERDAIRTSKARRAECGAHRRTVEWPAREGARGCGGGRSGRSKRPAPQATGSQRVSPRRPPKYPRATDRATNSTCSRPKARREREGYRAVRSVSAVIDRQNSAMSVAALSTSTSDTISFGECM
jgi:hypothetical protein